MRLVRVLRNRLKSEDSGFSLVWLAMILVLLLGMAGFATDLGWLYLNTVRTQNAVDAAALAGVVNLPGFDPAPDAQAAVTANGLDPTGGNLVLTPNADNQLHAELSTSIEPFFMRVFGFDQFNITRDATAEYVKPVPLGSPSNCFGGGATAQCPSSEDFWAAVSGRHTQLEDGDPFSTVCDLLPCDFANANYQRGGAYAGYYYGVEVDSSMSNLQIRVFDAAFAPGGLPGDSTFGGGSPINTQFAVYPPDTTPLIPNDHLTGGPICQVTMSPSSPGWANQWQTLCSPSDPLVEGIYLVYMETLNNVSGSNNFAVRATASGGVPKVYGINDMSIWSDSLVGASELYIAEIGEEHAGKKLELAFYDAGDATDESWYRVRSPFGSAVTCSWTVWDASYPLPSATQVAPGGSGTCEWQTQIPNPPTRQGVYNKRWIVATIDLPDDPADMCDETKPNPCFWKMVLDLSEPIERTTWRARVIGNPVRLLP
ncbi:MAG: Tad domain-containing protein [Acidimicrobiia bacterium]|jgi:hypothetical protein